MQNTEVLLNELRDKYSEWVEMGVSFESILVSLLIKERERAERIQKIYAIETSGVANER